MPDAFRGTHTALITPFSPDGTVNEPELRALVRRQVDGGVSGIVACGTTGEGATLTRAEQLRVIEIVIEEAEGRVAVTAGAGGNATQDVVEFVRRLERLKPDAVLSVVPYYNKPTPRGMLAHFRAVADASPAPLMLYNVPGRTARNMPAEVTLELAEHANIRSVKEASGDLEQVSRILKDAPKGFTVLSGDDSMTLPMMALGALGVVSVVSNLDPDRMSRLVGAVRSAQYDEARRLHHELSGLMALCFVESNPIPVKAAASMLGLCEARYRLPLVPLEEKNRPALEAELRRVGLLSGVAP
ncbi:MAG: 4-hydroxy-tetrahydrodipicolinate synthase [Gemmatimonadota bacterium]